MKVKNIKTSMSRPLANGQTFARPRDTSTKLQNYFFFSDIVIYYVYNVVLCVIIRHIMYFLFYNYGGENG